MKQFPSFATGAARFRTFIGFERDAKSQVRLERKQALAPDIDQVRARRREEQAFTKKHGTELEELGRFLAAPEIQQNVRLFRIAYPLKVKLEELRRRLTQVPPDRAKLNAAVENADTDEALDEAEADLRYHVRHQCQKSRLPDLENSLAEAQDHGEKLKRRLTALRADPEAAPAAVRTYPEVYVEYAPNGPRCETRTAEMAFDAFNSGGVR